MIEGTKKIDVSAFDTAREFVSFQISQRCETREDAELLAKVLEKDGAIDVLIYELD